MIDGGAAEASGLREQQFYAILTLPLFIIFREKTARLQAATANAANAAALRLELQQLDSELAEVQRVVPFRDELA